MGPYIMMVLYLLSCIIFASKGDFELSGPHAIAAAIWGLALTVHEKGKKK